MALRPLRLWDVYTREDVHSIFSPNTRFLPSRGTWGIQGIIKVPDRPDSFVLFVTLGRVEGAHQFDESITSDGVLSWQSQPQQTLDNPIVQTLINHDQQASNIYLFLRTHARDVYTFLGRLGFITYDPQRERPVHIQWQLLDGPIPRDTVTRMNLVLLDRATTPSIDIAVGTYVGGLGKKGSIVETSPPQVDQLLVTGTRAFKAVKLAIHPDQDARNRELGLAGENLVVTAEQARLRDAGRPDLAERVRHVAYIEGDGAGYDIGSFTLEGQLLYLEVKTTRSGAAAAFFVSPNELAFSQSHSDNYQLVRVYHYDDQTDSGKAWRVMGPLDKHFLLVPSTYRALVR